MSHPRNTGGGDEEQGKADLDCCSLARVNDVVDDLRLTLLVVPSSPMRDAAYTRLEAGLLNLEVALLLRQLALTEDVL